MHRTTYLMALFLFSSAIALAASVDDAFIQLEAQRSAYELEFARLGQVRATRSDVQTYAGILINDHEAYGDALRNLAASKGMVIPSSPTPGDKKRLDQLARSKGAKFDNAFIKEAQRINMVGMRAFRDEADHTTDPEIHGFVDRFLEMDAKHDVVANALSEQVLSSQVPVIHPPRTGDKMELVPPPNASSMPVIVPTPN